MTQSLGEAVQKRSGVNPTGYKAQRQSRARRLRRHARTVNTPPVCTQNRAARQQHGAHRQTRALLSDCGVHICSWPSRGVPREDPARVGLPQIRYLTPLRFCSPVWSFRKKKKNKQKPKKKFFFFKAEIIDQSYREKKKKRKEKRERKKNRKPNPTPQQCLSLPVPVPACPLRGSRLGARCPPRATGAEPGGRPPPPRAPRTQKAAGAARRSGGGGGGGGGPGEVAVARSAAAESGPGRAAIVIVTEALWAAWR